MVGRNGAYELGQDQMRVLDAEERVVPQPSLAQVRCVRGPALAIDSANNVPALGIARMVGVADSAEARLADLPLIVEDLLGQARQLADFGAPTEAVKAVLDLVAALREGRG